MVWGPELTSLARNFRISFVLLSVALAPLPGIAALADPPAPESSLLSGPRIWASIEPELEGVALVVEILRVTDMAAPTNLKKGLNGSGGLELDPTIDAIDNIRLWVGSSAADLRAAPEVVWQRMPSVESGSYIIRTPGNASEIKAARLAFDVVRGDGRESIDLLPHEIPRMPHDAMVENARAFFSAREWVAADGPVLGWGSWNSHIDPCTSYNGWTSVWWRCEEGYGYAYISCFDGGYTKWVESWEDYHQGPCGYVNRAGGPQYVVSITGAGQNFVEVATPCYHLPSSDPAQEPRSVELGFQTHILGAGSNYGHYYRFGYQLRSACGGNLYYSNQIGGSDWTCIACADHDHISTWSTSLGLMDEEWYVMLGTNTAVSVGGGQFCSYSSGEAECTSIIADTSGAWSKQEVLYLRFKTEDTVIVPGPSPESE